MNFAAGTLFEERYEILELLGEGGMGSVYKVRQTDSNQIIGLKILHTLQDTDPENAKRFSRESKALSRLSQKNIVTFYHFGITAEGLPYASMEYLKGKSLKKVLNETERLSPPRSIAIIKQVFEALAHAHELGIFHRDLKPDNIILVDLPEPDFVKVVDFGLAKLTPKSGLDTEKLTKTGLLIGSIHYMSPEQARGLPVDARSDVYAAGCVMFEMLTGQKPFDADNPIGLLYKQCNEAPEAFANTALGNACPAQIEWVCRKAMDKNPDLRYQSMNEMLNDLHVLQTLKGTLLAREPAEIPAPTPDFIPDKKKEKAAIKLIAISATAILLPLLLWFGITKSNFLPSKEAIVVKILTESQGPPATPWLRTPEAQSGPKVKGWKLEQENPHTGTWIIYLAQEGMACVNEKMGCTLVTREPNWNVVMFNDKTKVYFLSPLSEWKGASVKASTTGKSKANYSSMLVERKPNKLQEGVIAGHPATEYLTDNLASTGLKKVEFWMANDVQTSAELKQVFSKIYGVGLSAMDGLPLQVSYIDENGKRTPVFTTIKTSAEEIPLAYFDYPAQYKRVDSEIAVLMDKKGQEAMKSIMDDTARKEKGADNVDDLLTPSSSKHKQSFKSY